MEINKDTLSIEGLKVGDKLQRFIRAKDGSLDYGNQLIVMELISNIDRWRLGRIDNRTGKLRSNCTCTLDGITHNMMSDSIFAYYSNDPSHLKEGERLIKLRTERANKAKALKDKQDKSNLDKMNKEIQGVLAKYGGSIDAEQLNGDDQGVEIAVVYSVGDQEITETM